LKRHEKFLPKGPSTGHDLLFEAQSHVARSPRKAAFSIWLADQMPDRAQSSTINAGTDLAYTILYDHPERSDLLEDLITRGLASMAPRFDTALLHGVRFIEHLEVLLKFPVDLTIHNDISLTPLGALLLNLRGYVEGIGVGQLKHMPSRLATLLKLASITPGYEEGCGKPGSDYEELSTFAQHADIAPLIAAQQSVLLAKNTPPSTKTARPGLRV
jgi:hypothetical protein